MKLAKLLCVSAIICGFSNFLFAQTAPNFENGWKPYGSYDGSHLDTVNLMNGNVMLHAPLLPGIPQRGSLSLDYTIYVSSKDWQVACTPNSGAPSGQICNWKKGGTGISIVRPFDVSVHRTLTTSSSGTGTVTFMASGYTVSSADGATHKLHGVAGSEDANGVPTIYDSVDLTGYHLQMSVLDENNVLSTFTLTDRHGNVFQGTFPPFDSGCKNNQGNELSGGSHAPLIDDAPLGATTCSETAGPALVTDSNGNQMSVGPSNISGLNLTFFLPTGGTDTLGRAMPPIAATGTDPGPCVTTRSIVGTFLFNYQAPDGTVRQAKLCSANVPIQTAFNVSGVNEAVTGVNSLEFEPIVSLVLADGSTWSFDYDSYGELTSVGLPTGGSIAYTWQTISFAACNNATPLTRAVKTRTLTDGQGNTTTWTYNWGPASLTAITNSVTDPAGNDAVHSFTSQGGNCNLFETSVTEYQGAQSANQPLRKVDTAYSSTGTTNTFATDVTTTVYPSGKVKRVHHDPDPGLGTGLPIFGNVVRELEYDWGQGAPGALLRETDTVYQWQKNSAYLTAHLLDLPASKIIISPSSAANVKTSCPVTVTTTASCAAETDYSYDEAAYLSVPSPAVTVQHTSPPNSVRGNLSTSSSWLSSSNSFVSSHTKWYDTGEPFQKIDPLGHTTTLSYDPAYAGGYITQTCSPQTGSVTHCVSGTYDFNTGVLTSLTNENATTQASGNTLGDAAHRTDYGYDFMFRIGLVQAPPDPANGSARAQNTFSYSLPNTFPLTFTRQKSITTALTDSATTTLDGLGRVITTSHAMPSGSPSLVTTLYDDLHSKVTVSNPYFTTSDPTYGTTITQSDALGRATTVTKQDGSVSSVDYSGGNCTVTTDEAGKVRKACSDALGRLVEVDEPNPGAGISTAAGSVSINGHEQANPQPVVPGTGWVTIGGTLASFQSCLPPPHQLQCHTVSDSGGVMITVNGYAKSEGYGLGASTTAVQLASALAGDFHNDPSSPVDAVIDPSNNTRIDFTSRSQTLAGNYSLSVSAYTNDPDDFGSSSFTSTQSGSTLTGGRDATTSPDTGTVSITVNGVAYSTSFGGADTDGSGIASRLASLISAGAYASATAVGSTVNLTSKTAGPGGNYSLSAAYTWNSASFAQPSFTTGPSGNGLSGGYNASDISNNPFVTLYTYDVLGNLLRVDQKGSAPNDSTQWRTRTFTYDSLSRLLTATNPESGTITYSYDADGNLLQKTSPAPNQTGTATQTVSYCYDELHRVTAKGYGAQSCPLSTPVISYVYDSGANAKGKLTSLTDQAGTASYTYDILGRLSAETRTLTGANNASISKNLSYEYNLDGSLYKLHYPSGNVLTYEPGAAGLTLSAKDSGNNINYVTSATYGPDSALTGFISGYSGGFAGITNAFSYNKRLQPLAMSAAAPGQTVFSIGYDFHFGADNNGNVYGITNYKDNTRSQTFTYDALNRLASAQNAGTDCTVTVLGGLKKFWGNNYTYDAWGNLIGKSLLQTPPPAACAGENLSVTADAHNWIHASGTDYQYDAAGNMTRNVTPTMQTYTYDQENRLTGAAGYAYAYDSDGNRVRKSNSSTGTLYWYMTPGIVGESDLSGNLTDEYVFFDGERVARKSTNGVFYYFSDHLKTASVITDSLGNIKSESDFYPWGGELQFVANDANHYKFTGKERDAETQLDYFGARYYSNGLGRWISADWSATPVPVPYADFGDPQSLNLYGFVGGNPASKADPDGHFEQEVQTLPAPTADDVKLISEAGKRALAEEAGEAAATTAKGGTPAFGTVLGVVGIILGFPQKTGGPDIDMLHYPPEQIQKTSTPQPEAAKRRYRKGARFSRKTAADRKKKANGQCEYCDVKTTPGQQCKKGACRDPREGTTDHYDPRSRGGTNDPENARHACLGCNQKKSDKPPEEWEKTRGEHPH